MDYSLGTVETRVPARSILTGLQRGAAKKFVRGSYVDFNAFHGRHKVTLYYHSAMSGNPA
jgi:hypothetical protein